MAIIRGHADTHHLAFGDDHRRSDSRERITPVCDDRPGTRPDVGGSRGTRQVRQTRPPNRANQLVDAFDINTLAPSDVTNDLVDHLGCRISDNIVGLERTMTPWLLGNPADAHRFAVKVLRHPDVDCWLWMGGLTSDGGYGRFRTAARVIAAHRWSYLAATGPTELPVIRHTCDIRCCMNPTHLLAGTQADNIADTVRRRAWTTRARTGPGAWPQLAYRLRDAARTGDIEAIQAILDRPEQLVLWPDSDTIS